jgi:Collagen triple helix repeat (20 copies)
MTVPFDGKAFGGEVVKLLKSHLDPLKATVVELQTANAALVARIADLEAKAPVAGPVGPQGEPGVAGEVGPQGNVGIAGVDGKAGIDGRDGRDGIDGKAGADGTAGVDGKDGAPGRDGQPGVPGREGADGLGFDDLDMEYDGERSFKFILRRGDRVKEFEFAAPILLDRGVWQQGNYVKADGVTWRGSFWIAQRDTSSKPDDNNSGWRLAVKRGRDGKDMRDMRRVEATS